MRVSLLFFNLVTVVASYGADWKPVTAEQLSLKVAKIDPNADAEALFWEVWVKDDRQGSGLNHVVENYLRIKLYNDRAVDKYGDIEIPYYSEQKMSVFDIQARTIKPNGQIIELGNGSVKDSTVSKSGRKNVKVKSFAMPGLEPGAIIEYQWTETYTEYVPRYVELVMQREIPIWDVTYNVRPYMGYGFSEQMRAYPFNCAPSKWEPVRDSRHQEFVSTTVKNMAAFIEEPHSPSRDDLKAWMLLYYTPTSKEKPESYWPSLGKQLQGEFRKLVKINDEVKQVAQQVTAGGNSAFEKADLLAKYCQSQIKNVSYSAEGMTSQLRSEFFKNLKEFHNSQDTLKLKTGTSMHVLTLFFALAEAAGLDPVYVRAGSSNGAMFRMDFLDPYLLRNRMVAITSGSDVRFYNPGMPYLPPGMADWDEQGQAAVFAHPKQPKLIQIPPSEPESSRLVRRAELKLSPDGNISGKVNMKYSGHLAATEKLRLEGLSDAEREEEFRKRIEARYPGSTLTNCKINNANSALGELSVSFDIEMNQYGQRTGKRLFFQPAFFQFGDKPVFSSNKRVYPISFRHAYEEDEEIKFQIPEGFQLDNAEMPGTFNMGEVGSYSMSGGVSKDNASLTIRRKLTWGKKGAIFFEASAYPALKKAWDNMHNYDNHSLTLKAN